MVLLHVDFFLVKNHHLTDDIKIRWDQQKNISRFIKSLKGKVTQQKTHLHNANARIDFLMQAQFRNLESKINLVSKSVVNQKAARNYLSNLLCFFIN